MNSMMASLGEIYLGNICWNLQIRRLLLGGGGGVGELEVTHFILNFFLTEINYKHVNISKKHKVKTCMKTHNILVTQKPSKMKR